MTRKVALSVALLSFLALMVGCRHQQTTNTVPSKASPPALIREENVDVAKAIHIGPASLYPKPSLTSGKSATLSVVDLTASYSGSCPASKATCTYSESHRNVSAADHKKVYDEYNVPAGQRNFQDGEVDHFYPMCAGGSNDISNLWYQPAVNKWKGKNFGYHEKDVLESYICREIKSGTLDPKVAYKRITSDWVAYYLELNLHIKGDGENDDLD